MGEILTIAYFIVTLLCIRDVTEKLRGDVERVLWIIAIVCLPLFGPAFWYYVQYVAVPEKRRRRERRFKGGAGGKHLG